MVFHEKENVAIIVNVGIFHLATILWTSLYTWGTIFKDHIIKKGMIFLVKQNESIFSYGNISVAYVNCAKSYCQNKSGQDDCYRKTLTDCTTNMFFCCKKPGSFY